MFTEKGFRMEQDVRPKGFNSWFGALELPRKACPCPDRASDVLSSEWSVLFTTWLNGKCGHIAKVMESLQFVQRHSSTYRSTKNLSKSEIPEDHRQKVSDFLDLYTVYEKNLTGLLDRFLEDVKDELKRGVSRSAFDRIPAGLENELKFHQENWIRAKGFAAHYIQVSEALVKVPTEIIKLRKDEISKKSEMSASGINLRKKEHAQFLRVFEKAQTLLNLSVNQLQLIDKKYKNSAEIPIWILPREDQQKISRDDLQAWYETTIHETTQFVEEAQRLVKKCEGYLIKAASPQLLKILHTVEPVHAGAAMVLRGLAGAIGVAAAFSSPIIGPASIPIGLASAAVTKFAVKVEKDAARHAARHDPELFQTAVTKRLKSRSLLKKITQATKGGVMATEGVERLGTQIEAASYTPTGAELTELAGPFTTAMDSAGVPLAALGAVLNIGIKGATYVQEKEAVDKFADPKVRDAVSALVSAVSAEIKVTYADKAKTSDSLRASTAALNSFKSSSGGKYFECNSSDSEEKHSVPWSSLASSAKFKRLEGDRYVFHSKKVELTLGIQTGGSLDFVEWRCSSEGKFVPEEDVKKVIAGDGFITSGSGFTPISEIDRQFIGSGAELSAFIWRGLRGNWIARDQTVGGSVVSITKADYGFQREVVDKFIYRWNFYQRQLIDRYKELAATLNLDVDWDGQPNSQDIVRDSETMVIHEGPMGALLAPKDSTDKSLCLKVALLNRANGYKEVDLRALPGCCDNFEFDIPM
ncbi:hypothetical protein [Streptomyces sp. NBC_00096]|uniref:hypothetical protein n=1 Tax=Streptomyces sp. NBC_00096 TaxID=2975650 RepID=UPI0032490094